MSARVRTKRSTSAGGLDLDLLPELIGYQLKRAHDRVYRSFGERLARIELTQAQFGLLLLVGANPGATQSELADVIGSNRSFMVRMVDRLESLGLLERRRLRSDRRAHAIFLTAEGATTLTGLKRDVLRHEAEMTKALSERDACTLLSLLARLNDGAEPDPKA